MVATTLIWSYRTGEYNGLCGTKRTVWSNDNYTYITTLCLGYNLSQPYYTIMTVRL